MEYFESITAGDFNGDGLTDFLSNAPGSDEWYYHLNDGDGTFSVQLACTLPESYSYAHCMGDQKGKGTGRITAPHAMSRGIYESKSVDIILLPPVNNH